MTKPTTFLHGDSGGKHLRVTMVGAIGRVTARGASRPLLACRHRLITSEHGSIHRFGCPAEAFVSCLREAMPSSHTVFQEALSTWTRSSPGKIRNKHGGPGRIEDADDVMLMQANQLDPKSPEQREIFETIEQKNSTKKSCEFASRTEPADLGFPDWSGMDDSPDRKLRYAYPQLIQSSRPLHAVESRSDLSPARLSLYCSFLQIPQNLLG